MIDFKSNLYLSQQNLERVVSYGILGALAAKSVFHLPVQTGALYGVFQGVVATGVLNHSFNEKHPLFSLVVTVATFVGTSFIAKRLLRLNLSMVDLLPGVAFCVAQEMTLPKIKRQLSHKWAALYLNEAAISKTAMEVPYTAGGKRIKRTDLERMQNAFTKANGDTGGITDPEKIQPLSVTHGEFEMQGPCPYMQDDHFYLESQKYVLAGVFDGHGGAQVAQYANRRFPALFLSHLEKNEGNVRKAFVHTFAQIHEECRPLQNSMLVSTVKAVKSYFKYLIVNVRKAFTREKLENFKRVVKNCHVVGSTAVVSFIEKETGRIYTASLGDAEGRISREGLSEIQGKKRYPTSIWNNSIKLTGVRDWLIESEGERAKTHSEKISNVDGGLGKSKWCLGEELEASRALGDYSYKAVSQKPVVTVSTLKPGDWLFLGSHGFWEGPTLNSGKIADKKLDETQDPQELASHLANEAAPVSKDNVTLITMKFAEDNK